MDEHAAAPMLTHIVLRRRGIVGRRATPGPPWGAGSGRRRLAIPRRHTSGGHRGGADHELQSSAAPAMGDPGPDSDIFEGRAGESGSPFARARACADRAPGSMEMRAGWNAGPFLPWTGRTTMLPAAARIARGYFRGRHVRTRQRKKNDACLEAALFVYSSFLSRLWPECALSRPLFICLRTCRRP